MAGAFLHDLRGLSVLTITPPDAEGNLLNGQLRRVGCTVHSQWPVPAKLPPMVDVVFLSIHEEEIPELRHLLQSLGSPAPTMIAIVGYENPATLQVVLEHNFFAIVERPLRSFGLLANLAIARNLWLQHQSTLKELRSYKRRALGDQKVVRAKSVLMACENLTEEQAYKAIRARAQAARLPIESIAEEILADDRLRTQAGREASRE